MDAGIIILAAGSSTRMGRSKQLMELGEETLIARAVRVAGASGMKVVVVLGAEDKKHAEVIRKMKIDIVFNPDWQSGMASSIKAGLRHFSVNKNIHGVIVMVCDQPLLTSAHLTNLRDQWISTHKPIIASYYAGTVGVPALFDQSMFPEMLTLMGEGGAKKIIQNHPDKTAAVIFPEGSFDLDTPDDYKNFLDRK